MRAEAGECQHPPPHNPLATSTVADPPNTATPLARALEWVAKITTIGLEMCLPAIGGHFLDLWLHTEVFAALGLVLGFSVGFYHLLYMTGVIGKPKNGPPNEKEQKR